MDAGNMTLVNQTINHIEELVKNAQEYSTRVIDGIADGYDRDIAENAIMQACLDFIILTEQYPDNHGTLIDEAKILRAGVQKEPFKSKNIEGDIYTVWPWELAALVRIFKVLHIEGKDEVSPDIALLMGALKNSELYITDRRVFSTVPREESDVHYRIEGMIKTVYPDTIRKPRLSKPIKSFEPDTGIPSLKTLIEYKYIEKYDDGKRILDEVFADILGYQSEDYSRFIFVIYETYRLFSFDDWNAAIKKSKPPSEIHVVLLKGIPYSASKDT